MEESQPPHTTDQSPSIETSLVSRLTNIFVSPSEVFDEIKVSKRKPANWIVPLVMAMIGGIIFTLVVFSQPAIIQKMKEAQEKKMEDLVATGKMTEAQADQAMAAAEKYMGPGFLKLMGIAGSVFANVAILFFLALVLWLLGRFVFHNTFPYMQAVEAVGLATMISVLGLIVALLLSVIYGDMTISPSPALLISHFDLTNRVHRALAALNVFSLWHVGILALGVARLSDVSFAKAALWLYSLWAIVAFVPILLFGGK